MSKLVLKDNPTLADYQQYVREMVAVRGFSDSIADKFMLLLEEAGEFAKAGRKAAGMKMADNAAKQNAAHEAADVFIVMIALCNMLNIDLEQAFRSKEAHNKQRSWQ